MPRRLTYWIVLAMVLIMIDDELIVVLSPGEYVTPVRQVVWDHGQAIPDNTHAETSSISIFNQTFII